MKIQEVLEKAKSNNALTLTDIDRFDDRFNDYKKDNSFNWYDINIYTFEIRQKNNLTFCFLPNDDSNDPRGLSYDENCVLFTDLDDFYNFVIDIKEENEEENEEE